MEFSLNNIHVTIYKLDFSLLMSLYQPFSIAHSDEYNLKLLSDNQNSCICIVSVYVSIEIDSLYKIYDGSLFDLLIVECQFCLYISDIQYCSWYYQFQIYDYREFSKIILILTVQLIFVCISFCVLSI